MVTPPFLQPGDTVGMICPAGRMPEGDAETCISILKQWGYEVKTGFTLYHQFHYFSGTDEERLTDLQQMLDDPEIKAILFARGGYGLSRIIDQINFEKFLQRPKWLIGYSDLTILHNFVHSNLQVATLHSPMAAAFNNEEYKNPSIQWLRKVLAGEKVVYTSQPHELNQPGTANGVLVGGNLSLITHSIGTPSDVDTCGKILFIEDVGEYIYNIDRMMHQLKRSGKLADLSGMIIGSFTDMKDTVVPFGKTVYETIHELLQQYSFPYCFDFPVGHSNSNHPLKVGIEHILIVEKTGVSLREI